MYGVWFPVSTPLNISRMSTIPCSLRTASGNCNRRCGPTLCLLPNVIDGRTVLDQVDRGAVHVDLDHAEGRVAEGKVDARDDELVVARSRCQAKAPTRPRHALQGLQGGLREATAEAARAFGEQTESGEQGCRPCQVLHDLQRLCQAARAVQEGRLQPTSTQVT